jgi:hypothetical protein
MGPKAMRRAARWADGISGFALGAAAAEMADSVSGAVQAWSEAGRSEAPRMVSGCFYVLGGEDPGSTLSGFTYDYLEIFGRGIARQLAADAPVWNSDRLTRVLDDAESSGIDEFILVPGTTDPQCLEATVELVASR